MELAYTINQAKKKKSKKLGVGRKPFLSTTEDELMERIAHEREKQHHLPCKLIQVWEQEMAHENGVLEFRASRGWLSKFLRRFNLTIRKRTTTGQSLPREYQEKVRNFVEFNKKQRDLYKLEPSMIANMDETPIWAGMHTVPIRTTGHEKNKLTVCLAVKADGTKMKPYVVIPGKKVKEELNPSQGLLMLHQLMDG